MTNADHAGARHPAVRLTRMDLSRTQQAARTGLRPAVATLVALLCAACGGDHGADRAANTAEAPVHDGGSAGSADSAGSAPKPLASDTPPLASVACDAFTSFENVESDACLSCYFGDACSSTRTAAFAEQLDGHTCPNAAMECQTCPTIVTGPGYCACQRACLGACQPALDAWFQCLVSQCSAACM
jgi:hypothetical protein